MPHKTKKAKIRAIERRRQLHQPSLQTQPKVKIKEEKPFGKIPPAYITEGMAVTPIKRLTVVSHHSGIDIFTEVYRCLAMLCLHKEDNLEEFFLENLQKTKDSIKIINLWAGTLVITQDPLPETLTSKQQFVKLGQSLHISKPLEALINAYDLGKTILVHETKGVFAE